ncbi:hypothetical protein IDG46_09240, partial [Staphylococcus sp. EG-SA-13]|nr:hypothetical protein [Staphylococcus sp. EG-SA-13]
MAYEYEEFLIKQFNEAYRAGNLKQINLIKELKEVYAKAKAWDNYLADVENSVREVTGNEDEVKWHVDYVI